VNNILAKRILTKLGGNLSFPTDMTKTEGCIIEGRIGLNLEPFKTQKDLSYLNHSDEFHDLLEKSILAIL